MSGSFPAVVCVAKVDTFRPVSAFVCRGKLARCQRSPNAQSTFFSAIPSTSSTHLPGGEMTAAATGRIGSSTIRPGNLLQRATDSYAYVHHLILSGTPLDCCCTLVSVAGKTTTSDKTCCRERVSTSQKNPPSLASEVQISRRPVPTICFRRQSTTLRRRAP